MKTALTIAGSDCSGGAGIQADIKTMIANGVYAMSAITALTAQNTVGVRGICDVAPEFLKLQLDVVFEDIFPNAVKIGMVSSSELIYAISERLRFYNAKNIVVDPVMVATSGSQLIKDNTAVVFAKELFPIAEVITPNIPEAEVFAECEIKNSIDMEVAAVKIGKKYNTAVLVKGGHNINDASDVLYKDGRIAWFEEKRVDNPNTHGTGCTLSSAIASNLAKGLSLENSVENAKKYITGALLKKLNLGAGSGPLDHGFKIIV